MDLLHRADQEPARRNSYHDQTHCGMRGCCHSSRQIFRFFKEPFHRMSKDAFVSFNFSFQHVSKFTYLDLILFTFEFLSNFFQRATSTLCYASSEITGKTCSTVSTSTCLASFPFTTLHHLFFANTVCYSVLWKMSAKDEMRAMLAQLMGTSEGWLPSVWFFRHLFHCYQLLRFAWLFSADTAPKVRFTERTVCRPFLLGCCPHEVLDSTV